MNPIKLDTRPAGATLLMTVAWLLTACGSPTEVFPDLTIITEELPAATHGHPYEATVQAEGGDGEYVWTRTSGNLPPGVTLTTDEAGQVVLAGPVLAAGTFTFTLQVESGDGQSASRTFTVEATAALAISTTSLPPGNLETTYAEAVHAVGGDGAYFWTLTEGSLPPGLDLGVDDLGEQDHALITGVPTEEGTFTFRIQVESGDGQSASRQFSITIDPRLPLAVVTPAVPPALATAPYDVGLESSGGVGELEWRLAEGTLPAGLQLTVAGRIQGTPTNPQTTQFTAEVRSGEETAHRSFSLEVVENRTGEYNITIFAVTDIPDGVGPHLDQAVADWEAAITGNLQAIALRTAQFDASGCGGFIHLADGTATDDLMVIVSIDSIDGPGQVLGRAGPCLIRTGEGVASLPPLGVVTLDSADLRLRVGDQELTHIISHELGHVLGFGTLWNQSDRAFRTGTGGDDPRFVGENAVREYQALGGDGDVPVENEGGSGTRDSHWRQTVFGNERMTGFSAGRNVFQPLSRVSIASLLDLGYVVDMSQADNFNLPAALMWPDDLVQLRELLIEPIGVVYPDGRTRPIQPR